jgi:two-component system response regulator NreC
MWRALYDEKWSIFDQFDSDGRRFLIVRRNSPKADPTTNLSAREQQIHTLVTLGHSNKAIAYELGLSVSTVAAHVSHLKRRYGARTRAELIRAMHTRTGQLS